MEILNKKTDSVLVKMLQSKPIVLPSTSATAQPRICTKRAPLEDSLSDDDDVLILDEPRRWTKKRRLLGKSDKKSTSGGEDDSGTEPGSSSSSSGSPSDGECCECPNDSGCDEDDDDEDTARDKIEELCWQLEENFKENNVSWLGKNFSLHKKKEKNKIRESLKQFDELSAACWSSRSWLYAWLRALVYVCLPIGIERALYANVCRSSNTENRFVIKK